MFELSSFLKEVFNSPDNLWESPDLLPPIKISPALAKGIDQVTLDFLASLYFSAKKGATPFAKESEVWFLEEINQSIHDVYPGRSRREYVIILQQIIRMSDPNYGKETK